MTFLLLVQILEVSSDDIVTVQIVPLAIVVTSVLLISLIVFNGVQSPTCAGVTGFVRDMCFLPRRKHGGHCELSLFSHTRNMK
jgi:hypothetical protein